MHNPADAKTATLVAALLLGGLAILPVPALAQSSASQTQSGSPPARPKRHDSVEVVAHLSPEEAEEGKLNDAYEAIAGLQRKGNCSAEIIQRYRSEVIPLAARSSFNVPKNKFLFLANRDIANCFLHQQKFVEAEASFREIFQYASVWPGTDDSAYPINFRQIATAQMGQEHWSDAEQSLLKSVSLFDPQIAAAEKSDSQFIRDEHSRNLRGSHSEGLALLAVVYFREGRIQEALTTVERAYDEVMKYSLAPQFHNDVVKVGQAIAGASEDPVAQRTWSERNLIQ